MRVEVERSPYVEDAQKAWDDAVRLAPALQELRTTPQGAPAHIEGTTVQAHVLRMLTALIAIQGGASIAQIEGYAGAAHLEVDIALLERTLKEQYATFALFCLLHDYGKTSTVRIAALAKESPQTASLALAMRNKKVLLPNARNLYGKLYAATAAKMGGARTEEYMIDLHETYGIEFSFIEHEKWFVNDDSVRSFSALFEQYRITPRDIDQLKFLVRYHVLAQDLVHHRGKTTLQLLERVALESGLDVHDARDIWLGAIFLNEVCGKIGYEGRRIVTHESVLFAFVNAEEESFAQRRTQKKDLHGQQYRLRIKQALQEAGLTIEDLLRTCQVPHDATRELFVQSVYGLITKQEGVTVEGVFGTKAQELFEQVKIAQSAFDESV